MYVKRSVPFDIHPWCDIKAILSYNKYKCIRTDKQGKVNSLVAVAMVVSMKESMMLYLPR